MAEIVFSEEAFADLERILDFLLETSFEHAADALHDITSAIDVLGKYDHVFSKKDNSNGNALESQDWNNVNFGGGISYTFSLY